MNSIYRSIWNPTSGNFVAVSENVRGAGKQASSGGGGAGGGAAARFALKALAAGVMLACGASSWAAPQGGTVAAGSATIVSTPGVTTINQGSQKAALNWQSFNIGQGETVRFVQPGSDSVALNRVTGADASSILGHLSANGKVFLVNPNGILFGRDASVNVGALVASSLNLSDADFMAGRYAFGGEGRGAVVNEGAIHADGGFVALLGAEVRNDGAISARLGTVALAAGRAITLDVAGDGLLNVAIEQGALNALVQNGGLIAADGGQVLLSAQAAGQLLGSMVNNTGVIQARTVENRNGVIKLLGDMQSGTVKASGTLDASAPGGGDGGFIEASAAHVKLAPDVNISTAAALGKTGTFLIDPQDYSIGGLGGDITPAALVVLLNTTSVVISTDTSGPASTPSETHVYSSAAGLGDINVKEAVTWNAATTLTLKAAHDVNIDAAITVDNGNFVVCCGNDIKIGTGGTVTANSGSMLLSAGRDISMLGTLTANSGNIALCAGRDIDIQGTITMSSGNTNLFQSLSALGVKEGLTLSAGYNARQPGELGGTVKFGATSAASVSSAPVTIFYNPLSYAAGAAAPQSYVTKFAVLSSAPLKQYMWVFPQAVTRTYNGSKSVVLNGLKGAPAGVTLNNVAGVANYLSAGAGTNKTIVFSGYTLGYDALLGADYALPLSCCAPIVSTTSGTVRAASPPPVVVVPPPVVVVPPPVVVVPPPVIVPPVVVVPPPVETPPPAVVVVPPVDTPPVVVAPPPTATGAAPSAPQFDESAGASAPSATTPDLTSALPPNLTFVRADTPLSQLVVVEAPLERAAEIEVAPVPIPAPVPAPYVAPVHPRKQDRN
jgi:filamentous hemagglutinin family protein